MKHTGKCSCSKVEYEVHGELTEATACHCSMCRKMSGSYSMSFAAVNPTEFKWVKGVNQLNIYNSSEDMGSYFCSNCGSTLAGTYKGELCWVALGGLEGSLPIKIEKHIFMGSKASWETNPAEVIQSNEY